MKKTIAVLGLAAVSNAIHNNYVDDEYFGLGVNINSKVQTANVHGSRGVINVNMKDDADNELRNIYNMPGNQGDIQFNDYTVKGKKDDADDELFLGIKINNKVQHADVSHSRGMINVNMNDDADNELHNTYNMPGNKGNIQFNDYSKTKDDELFGLGVDIKSKVQTVNASHSRGKVNLNFQDDADNELHNTYNMPGNKGNIQFNDYSKAKDDELWGLGVDIKSKVQTADVSHSRGRINVNMRDDAEDEFWGLGADIKSKVQTVNASHSRGKVNLNFQDDADNELHNTYNMPGNKGNIQFNDYSKAKDDELFFGIKINNKVQTADVSHSHGMINVNMRDDADNELRNVYNMPGNKGDIQFNDYTVKSKKDDADDELFGLGVDIKSKVQTVNASHSRGKVNLNFQDDADNELNNIFNMPGNKGNIQFNDYTVQGKGKKDDADDEFWGLDLGIKSKVQTADVSRSRGTINVNMKDDAEDEFWGLGVDIKSKVQTADVSRSRGTINVNMKDDAEDEFWGLDLGIKSKVQTADVSRSRGTINVNMKDDADDEFFSRADKLNRDEIDVLRSLLKHATQDKNGNVLLDGVKIGKIPQVKEHKTVKTNTTSKPHASIPERKFLAY